ncbi:MAG: phosphoesterase [Parcubacteria group bacterium]|nr:phosphoesterase [Parcubacteria group bacterium]
MKIIGVYHGDCSDGTAAAAVLLKKFPSIKLFPLKHHFEEKDFAPIIAEVDEETTVYTVDNVLGVEEFVKKAKEVISLDHHIGANEEMKAFAAAHPNFTYIFDNNKSGASLTWTHFFGEETMPELVRLVQDFDLWQWKFGDRTKYLSRFMISFANQPNKVLEFFDENIETLLEQGKTISVFADYVVENYASRAEPLYIKIGGYTVPAFNAQFMFVSEIGHALAERLKSTVLLFSIHSERVHMSFRSMERYSPTSLELAQLLGGGGHRLAAGAYVPLEKFWGMLQHDTNIRMGTNDTNGYE